MLLQAALLLNVHAKDGPRDEVTKRDETDDGVNNAHIIDLGVLAGRAECEAGTPEREAAAAGAEGLFGVGVQSAEM